jgi:hypothetical protein
MGVLDALDQVEGHRPIEWKLDGVSRSAPKEAGEVKVKKTALRFFGRAVRGKSRSPK